MRRFAALLLLLLLSGLVLTAQGTPTPQPMPDMPCSTLNAAIGPCFYPDDVSRLTGLPVTDPAVLQRRPVVVKVSNSPALVRPQAGIGAADLVFEHYTEVGITRFSAIFQSQAPQRVGSIRSARLIDYELVPMYQGILAFAGASIGVDKRIYGSEAVIENLCFNREDREQCRLEADIIGPAGFTPPSDFVERAYKGVLIGAPIFYRDTETPIPHNLFVDVGALWQRASADGVNDAPDLRGMAFRSQPHGVADGSGVYAQIRYQTTLVEWHYEPESGRYFRSSDGQPHFDANSEEQISATNIAIVYAGHYLTDIIESQYNDVIHWSQQITVWPEGDAIILRDGLRYEGRWLRPTRPDLMRFETNAGEILYLKPGNTWFQLVRLPEQMNPDSEWVIVE